MDVSITLTQLLTILGLVLGIVSFLAGIVWNIWKKVIENGKNLDAYKLEVAERYVKTEQIVQMEKENAIRDERLHASIGALTSRIDRMLERFDRSQ
jgi:hypothetical protein